jgi:hypothetical protein
VGSLFLLVLPVQSAIPIDAKHKEKRISEEAFHSRNHFEIRQICWISTEKQQGALYRIHSSITNSSEWSSSLFLFWTLVRNEILPKVFKRMFWGFCFLHMNFPGYIVVVLEWNVAVYSTSLSLFVESVLLQLWDSRILKLSKDLTRNKILQTSRIFLWLQIDSCRKH